MKKKNLCTVTVYIFIEILISKKIIHGSSSKSIHYFSSGLLQHLLFIVI